MQEYNFENPLNADNDFQLLPLRTKVTVLWNLCDFRLDQEDVPEQLIRLESDSVRVDPLGYDSNSATYWYFYGTRLYREDKVKGAPLLNQPKKRKKNQENKADSNWQVVCFTEEDWQGLTEKFAKSSNKNERALHEVLNESFLPKIGGLFRKRERDRRVRCVNNWYVYLRVSYSICCYFTFCCCCCCRLVGERQSTRIRIRHEETTREREREEKRLKELAERRKREKAKQAEQKKRDKAEAIIREKALRIQRREEAARAIEEAKREQARVLELHGEHAAERSTGADTSEGEPEEEQRQEESQEESVEEFAGYSEEDEEEGYAGFDLSEEIDISPEF